MGASTLDRPHCKQGSAEQALLCDLRLRGGGSIRILMVAVFEVGNAARLTVPPPVVMLVCSLNVLLSKRRLSSSREVRAIPALPRLSPPPPLLLVKAGEVEHCSC